MAVDTYRLRPGFVQIAAFLSTAAHRQNFSSVVFASASRGEGTTTVAVNSARELRRRFGFRVLVIEVAAGEDSLFSRLGLDKGRSLAAVAAGKPSLECIYEMDGFTDILAVGPTNADTDGLESPSLLRRVIEECEEVYDFIIVDAPPVLDDVRALVAAVAVPRMLLVVEAGRTRAEALLRIKDQLAVDNVEILGAVLNKHQQFIPDLLYRRFFK